MSFKRECDWCRTHASAVLNGDGSVDDDGMPHKWEKRPYVPGVFSNKMPQDEDSFPEHRIPHGPHWDLCENCVQVYDGVEKLVAGKRSVMHRWAIWEAVLEEWMKAGAIKTREDLLYSLIVLARKIGWEKMPLDAAGSVIRDVVEETRIQSCSGCRGGSIHHTCGREPDADVAVEQAVGEVDAS
jgi:hypothetical protein